MAGLLLKNWGDRARKQSQIMQGLQPMLAGQTGAQIFAFSLPALPGSTGGPPVQFVIRTPGDYRQLAGVLDKLQAEARKSGLFIFTDGDLKFDTPQVAVNIDAAKANALGVTMQDVGATLATFLGGNYVNRFNLDGRSYQVIPQAPRDFRLTEDWLTRYQVRTGSGALAPLSTIASVTDNVQPNALTSFQQLNAATLSGVPFPGHTLGEALGFLQEKAKEIFPEGSPGISRARAVNICRKAIRCADLRVRADRDLSVLAAQFESFRDPLHHPDRAADPMFGALLPLNIVDIWARRDQHLYPDRAGDADRPDFQARHPDGRISPTICSATRACPTRGDRARGGRALPPILMTTAAMVVGMRR